MKHVRAVGKKSSHFLPSTWCLRFKFHFLFTWRLLSTPKLFLRIRVTQHRNKKSSTIRTDDDSRKVTNPAVKNKVGNHASLIETYNGEIERKRGSLPHERPRYIRHNVPNIWLRPRANWLDKIYFFELLLVVPHSIGRSLYKINIQCAIGTSLRGVWRRDASTPLLACTHAFHQNDDS